MKDHWLEILEKKGREVADALGRYRGTEPLIAAVARLSRDFHELKRELEEAKLFQKGAEYMERIALADLEETEVELTQLRAACVKSSHEIEQILGKALGYPWYMDDQKNFPGATALDGVCVGENVAESLAVELARRYADLECLSTLSWQDLTRDD